MRFFGLLAFSLASVTLACALAMYDAPHPQVEDHLIRRLFPELVSFWEQGNGSWPEHVQPAMKQLAEDRKVRAKSIDWNSYPYAVIGSLSMGPELTNEQLSPQAKMRLGIAVRQLHKGQAPWIVTAGGAALPAKTPYTE